MRGYPVPVRNWFEFLVFSVFENGGSLFRTPGPNSSVVVRFAPKKHTVFHQRRQTGRIRGLSTGEGGLGFSLAVCVGGFRIVFVLRGQGPRSPRVTFYAFLPGQFLVLGLPRYRQVMVLGFASLNLGSERTFGPRIVPFVLLYYQVGRFEGRTEGPLCNTLLFFRSTVTKLSWPLGGHPLQSKGPFLGPLVGQK